jgi:hypothetical protein
MVGFGVVVALLAGTGILTRLSMEHTSAAIGAALSQLQLESRLATQLTADVAQEVEAAARYVEDADSAAQSAFRRRSWNAHRTQRALLNLRGRTAQEIAAVAAMDGRLSEVEVHYALAHRLRDLGRADEAHAEARRAHELLERSADKGKLVLVP